jgi:hypothetical protein
MYLTKSRPDIMTAVSFGATKSSAPTEDDYRQLEYVIDYLRSTPDKGHRIFIDIGAAIQLYCEVDASYLVHTDAKGHTGYTIGLHPKGTFYNRNAKQTLVSTSSTPAEMRALYTLVKGTMFNIYLCSELNIELVLPTVIMEDNSECLLEKVQALHHGGEFRARTTGARINIINPKNQRKITVIY